MKRGFVALMRRTLLRFFGITLMVLGVALLGLVAGYYTYVKVADARFRAAARAEPAVTVLPLPSPTVVSPIPGTASPTASYRPTPSPTPTPLPATRIIIASIGVDAKVVEIGTKYNEKGELVWETAAFAVGHHIGTADPGEGGKIVMAGHHTSTISREGSVFEELPYVKLGDEITLYNASGAAFRYRVVETGVILPTDLSVMSPSSEEVLVLITCWPPFNYDKRFIATAKPY